MTGAFLIEIAGETAGVALPVRGGFRFAAALPFYRALDGASFPSVAAAQRAAALLARGRRDAAGPSARGETAFAVVAA
jgi:hypothetical protein